jgi:hypothetical protein
MGIFDRQITNKVSECKAKKEWQICVYCHAPFLTDTFETKCVRCRYFDVHLIKIKSRFMLFYIMSSTLLAIVYAFSLIRLIKITEKIEFLLLFLLIPTIFIGMLMWMVVNKYKD